MNIEKRTVLLTIYVCNSELIALFSFKNFQKRKCHFENELKLKINVKLRYLRTMIKI